MNDACIIGYGVVGKSTAKAFGIDKYYDLKGSNLTLEEASKYRYIFISLPTPTENGAVVTKDIYEIIRQLNNYPRVVDSIFIVRSTVYPGFSRFVHDSLGIENIVSNPEFLSEDTLKEDTINPQLIVVGADNRKYGDAVKALYEGRFKYKDIISTDSTTAELIKYSLNVFFATKVIFANQIFDYAQKVGANYETIKNVIEKHPWGSKNHFKIWYKGKRGVHGHCLPKDTEAFATMTNSQLFKVLLDLNERIKYDRSE